MHLSSYTKIQAFSSILHKQRSADPLVIVDYGSQDFNGSYRPLFADVPIWRYIGLDMEAGKNVDVVLKDPYDWQEFSDNSVDVFVSGQAFEHTEYLWLSLMEIERVLKPGGLCCLITPSSGPEHRFPTDCWRIYPDGMRALAKFAGLTILDTFTEWKPQEPYSDDSHLWQDTLLMAQKKIARAPVEEASLNVTRDTLKQRIRQISNIP